MKTKLKTNALSLYFIMAYAIAWGGCLLVAALNGFQPAAIGMAQIAIMFLFMLAGPSISGISFTAYFDGKAGLRELFLRVKNWHFNWRWAAVAILTIPILSTGVLMALSVLVSPIYRPDITLAKLGFGVVAGFLAGFFEELGWTGFALPRLQSKYSALACGLILGILWAFWHIMADFWGNRATLGIYWLPTFIIYWLMPLTAYRVLMVWVYKNSSSLPLMQIMHAFYSGTLGVVSPITSIDDGLLWKALFAASLWVVMAVVIIRFGGELSRSSAAANAGGYSEGNTEEAKMRPTFTD
ncbi:MAG: CPBP family intramembrane glutamic endopeptidase [Candidatus Promineifilaceae bacterium]